MSVLGLTRSKFLEVSLNMLQEAQLTSYRFIISACG
jgi:hypothetical protein